MRVKRNIPIIYALQGCLFAYFFVPVYFLFIKQCGLTISEALVLKSFLCFAIFAFEIPSGYVADIVGRKFSIILGGICCSIGVLIYCTFSTFNFFVIAELFSGLGLSMMSGSDSAILFDTLKNLEKEENYIKYRSKCLSITAFSEAICGFLGAYLASTNIYYPFYLRLLALITLTILAFFIVEPEREKLAPTSFKDNFKNITLAFKELIKPTSNLKNIVILSSIGFTATFIIVWHAQKFIDQFNVDEIFFGYAWIIFHIFLVLASIVTPKIEKNFNSKNILVLSIACSFIPYFILPFSGLSIGIALICLMYSARAVRTAIVSNEINQNISSELRATIISINSFVGRLMVFIIGPLSGLAIYFHSLEAGFIIVGLLLSLIFFFFLKEPLKNALSSVK